MATPALPNALDRRISEAIFETKDAAKLLQLVDDVSDLV